MLEAIVQFMFTLVQSKCFALATVVTFQFDTIMLIADIIRRLLEKNYRLSLVPWVSQRI